MSPAERWMGGRPAVLVGNPTAHSGRAADLIRRARALLDGAGIEHTFVPSEPNGQTVPLVQGLIDGGTRLVISLGGDGTFAEVAKGIMASRHAADVTMGMLPTGTANDQGKSLGLSAGWLALDRNVLEIAGGATTSLDVGEVEVEVDGKVVRDLFFDSFSIGFIAAGLATRNKHRRVVAKVPGLSKAYRDQLVYIGAVTHRLAHSYIRDVKFDCTAVVDGVVHQLDNMLDVLIKNTRIFGGEWVLDHKTESDDGKLELIPIVGRRDLTTRALAGFRHSPLGEAEFRKLGLEAAPSIPGATFHLQVARPGNPASQLDGEEWRPGRTFRVRCLPRALRILVPREPDL